MEIKDKKCLSCGGTMNQTQKQLAEQFKQEFEQNGIVRWVVLYDDNRVSFMSPKSFKALYNTKKQRTNAGVKEYIHISEFRTA